MKPIAVLLSGCGVQDGSEIHETVCALLAIRQQGGTYQCYAPDRPQRQVINHCSGEPMAESRNIMVESARIARGDIKPITDFNVDDVAALVMPGGFGAAKNLCDFALKGQDMSVADDVAQVITAMHQAQKPIVALCIAPMILAKLIPNARLTLGVDVNIANTVAALGGSHQKAGHGEVVIDQAHRLITSPCYMLDASIDQVYDGANHAIQALFTLLTRNP